MARILTRRERIAVAVIVTMCMWALGAQVLKMFG